MTTNEIVNNILAGVDIREAIEGSRQTVPVNESFAIGSYLKFRNGVDGFFARDGKNDVNLVFEQPMDGVVGKLNPTITFKLIGYSGDKAKIVAMVNDNLNGFSSGEVYLISRAALEANAKAARPRMNRRMCGRYSY